jgi:hypothetical protein
MQVWRNCLKFCLNRQVTHLPSYVPCVCIFAQSKNCGDRETAVASERLWNNIQFKAMAGKRTMERRPLLGSRFLISKNWRPLLWNGSVNTFPRQLLREWTVLYARAVPRSYKEDSGGNQVSTVREYSSVGRELAIQRWLERGSWRISTVRSRYQGTASEDTADCKRLSVCCGDL